MQILKDIGLLFRDTFLGWNRSDAMLHAAAVGYWLALSAAPLLIISIAIASQVFSQPFVEDRVVAQLSDSLGPEVATVIESLIQSSNGFENSRLATGIGVIFLLYSASNVFMQLQVALNAMWGIRQRADRITDSLLAVVKSRGVAAASVLTVGFLLLGSLLLNAIWTALPDPLVEPILSSLGRYRSILDVWTSPIVYWLLFGIIFKVLPRASIRWRDVWPGALLTAVLFWLGGYAIGLYLGYTFLTSIYGAAGTLIALLLWAYYSAWIMLFGAKFTYCYTVRFGKPIVPYRSMIMSETGSF